MNRYNVLSVFNKCFQNKESVYNPAKMLLSLRSITKTRTFNHCTNLSKRTFHNGSNISTHLEQFRNNSKSLYWCGIGVGSLVILAESLRRFGFKDELQAIEAPEIQKSDKKANFRSWNFIADVVEKAAPAVVYIEISGK